MISQYPLTRLGLTLHRMRKPDREKSRDSILNHLRASAVQRKSQDPPSERGHFSPGFQGDEEEVFKRNLIAAGGEFIGPVSWPELISQLEILALELLPGEIYCKDRALSEKLKKNGFLPEVVNALSEKTRMALTRCEYLVSESGSVVVSSSLAGSRKQFVYPPVHVVVACRSEITFTLEEAWDRLKMKYGSDLPSMISIITGPSRTADIEKTLVIGAHGPKKLIIFVTDHDV